MTKLGIKTVVYHGETLLGELDLTPSQTDPTFRFPSNEIRIRHLSPLSERSHPLSILHSISPYSLRCKLEPPNPSHHHHHQPNNNLLTLHAACFYDLKTAVVLIPDSNVEFHLVAMPSKQKKFPCFWCYAVGVKTTGLYDSCLRMLNLRCLSIVFDLDETLIVANTMKSFEDRMETIKGWIGREGDMVRANGMAAELKRYAEDRALLKQYAENDSVVVVEGGRVITVQFEEVLAVSEGVDRVVRPVIRLPEKNLVLTRINPENRDTSVLVRLRPAWEDLRSYLTAKGRKRFEVFVCTMAERDYALEMWRLLDPEAHLIHTKQLLNRVLCVKSGSKKSLLNVFHDGICHPNMAMVIDDRLKVWEDDDQPRVHVVPAFTPYYAPQAETANAVPVLCVARNVACNVRGGFFKEFDEILLRKISETFYEDDISSLPPPPDVSNYLISEETGLVPNGNGNMPFSEGISGAEVEQRLSHLEEKSVASPENKSATNLMDSRPEASQQPFTPVSNAPIPSGLTMPSQKGVLGPVKKDVRHTLGEPPVLKLPAQTSYIGWLAEGDGNKGQSTSRGYLSPLESDASKAPRGYPSLFGHGTTSSASSLQLPRGKANSVQESQKRFIPHGESTGIAEAAISQNITQTIHKETHADGVKINVLPSSLSISVLQEIGRRCSSKVEFKPILSTSKDLQFSVEVLFTGEKIGIGMGKTRKDAQQQAAENALRCLADKYLAYVTRSGLKDPDDKVSLSDNGFVWDDPDPQSDELASEEKLHRENAFEAGEISPVSTSPMVVSQQAPKLTNSPRLHHSLSAKRPREEVTRGSQSSSSLAQQRNGYPLS